MTAPAPTPVMLNGEPNPTGTGRYCPPAVCYCGACSWWAPIPAPSYQAATAGLQRQRKSGRGRR